MHCTKQDVNVLHSSHVAAQYLFCHTGLDLNPPRLPVSSSTLEFCQHAFSPVQPPDSIFIKFPHMIPRECTAPPPLHQHCYYCHFPPSHSIIFHYIPLLTLWSWVPRSCSCWLKCQPCSAVGALSLWETHVLVHTLHCLNTSLNLSLSLCISFFFSSLYWPAAVRGWPTHFAALKQWQMLPGHRI